MKLAPPPAYTSDPASDGWTPIRQAACEAIYRAIVEHRDDPTNTDLHTYTPELKQRIRRFISNIEERPLLKLVSRELVEHGYLRDGWPSRWPACGPRARSEPPDIQRELDSARMPEL